MKIKIEIKNRWTGSVIFSYENENNTILKTLLEAIKTSANLRSANLSGSNLRSADLSGADLSGANLSGADLSGADLSGADLRSANLRSSNLRSSNLSGSNLSGANLSGADLRSANLRSSNLRSSNLSGSNLSGANLSGANLSGANLSGANLDPIKADFYLILLNARQEVPALRQALIDGKVDGSTYTGECACLVGTIANARHCGTGSLPGIIPDAYRPAERWFAGIRRGDTPETNQTAEITLAWIDEFLILTKCPLPKIKK